MEIRLIQNQIGRFNLLGNDKSLTFSVGIFSEDNRIIKDEEKDLTATLYISLNEDLESNSDSLQDLFDGQRFDELLDEAIKYSKNVFGSTNYFENCLFFYEIYSKNEKELLDKLTASKKVKLENKISALQKQLEDIHNCETAENEMRDVVKSAVDRFKEDAEMYERWSKDYKEESEKFKDYQKSKQSKLDKYNYYIQKYKL